MKKTEQLEPPSTANRRILVVDDNPAIHADFRKILCPNQHTSSTTEALEAILFEEDLKPADDSAFDLDSAHQGQEALEKLKGALAEQRPYAVAFVDVRMPPGWDGIETIAHLWQADPRLQVVICTAYSDYSWEDMRRKLGQPASLVVLKKPFDNVEVQQLAHAMSHKWELNRQAGLKLEELDRLVAKRTAELQAANFDLSLSEERFAKAFHANTVGMAILSLVEGRFVDANEQMSRVTGYKLADILGSQNSDLFIWNNPRTVDGWIDAVKRGETVREGETEIHHQDGTLRQVLVSVAPVSLGDQPHGLFAIQDVTEHRLLERQLRQAQKMEGIGQLAAGIAHDFNNILTVIQGHAGLLQVKAADDPFTLNAAENILKSSRRAATLIRQLLMFSRKQVMQFRHMDLNESVDTSLSMLNRLVGEHVHLKFDPAPTLPAIHADNTMLEQITMNLAVNARDAMPEGGHVYISTDVVEMDRPSIPSDPEPRKGQFVRLTFRDTGCGMDSTVLTRLFEPFFTTKGVGKGTGLGLATVFGIVRQHNGWVEVASKTGQGTTFCIYFPSSLKPAEKHACTSDTAFSARGRETVLVAEDEDTLRELVCTVLTTQGYLVIPAATGAEALKLYEQATRPVNLLLTDMVMPGGVMGGELAARLCAIQPGLKVIYTSGYSPGMAGKDTSLLERKNFLPKPYSVGRLAQFVREVLDQPAKAN